ncbi:hypothetical protein AUJ16_01145 [Candidatus Micrarchaeota archaeon CG1_02_60_51]|nr:MAG: hypothetical protein AUJ16_01145 [Candidatus Micrarchaeota archaeon CG1_02_60_51]
MAKSSEVVYTVTLPFLATVPSVSVKPRKKPKKKSGECFIVFSLTVGAFLLGSKSSLEAKNS